MKTISKFIIPVIIIGLSTWFVIWKLGSNKKEMESNAALGNQKTVVFPVTVANPLDKSLSQGFELNGTFQPSHVLNFVSEMPGRVISHNIKNGQQLSKGDVMAKLDDEQIHIDMALATDNLDKLKSDLAKLENMLLSNAATKQQVEEMKMGIKSAESRITSLKRQLRMTTILSPISGIISKSFLENGSYLAPGAPIAEIVDISTLKMQVNVLDRDVVKLSVGKTIQIVPDVFPDTKISGQIIFISPKGDASRNFMIEIQISNQGNRLKAGMTGVALFDFTVPKSSLTLPVKCIVGGMQEPKVYVVVNNVVSLRKIKTGYIQGDVVEILDGLNETDVVVETGQLNIVDGSKVQIIK
jgi:RND family efflux transporter MFP subunit